MRPPQTPRPDDARGEAHVREAENSDAAVVAIANQKGGVGKTTTAVNLGACLGEKGDRVLLVDIDPQANATTGVGVARSSVKLSTYDVLLGEAEIQDAIVQSVAAGMDLLPSTLDLAGAELELVSALNRERRLRNALEDIRAHYRWIMIDCPPSLGLLTINALAAADWLLVPVQCEYYALEGLGQLMQNVELVRKNLNPALTLKWIVLSMYDARTRLAEEVAEEVRRHFGEKVCRTMIPRSVRLSEAPSYGEPITVYDPSSRGAIAYRLLAEEVRNGT